MIMNTTFLELTAFVDEYSTCGLIVVAFIVNITMSTLLSKASRKKSVSPIYVEFHTFSIHYIILKLWFVQLDFLQFFIFQIMCLLHKVILLMKVIPFFWKKFRKSGRIMVSKIKGEEVHTDNSTPVSRDKLLEILAAEFYSLFIVEGVSCMLGYAYMFVVYFLLSSEAKVNLLFIIFYLIDFVLLLFVSYLNVF